MLKLVKNVAAFIGFVCLISGGIIGVGALAGPYLPASFDTTAKPSKPTVDTSPSKYFVLSLEFAGALTEPTHVLVPRQWVNDDPSRAYGSSEFVMLVIPPAHLAEFQNFKEGMTRPLPANFQQWKQFGRDSDFFMLTHGTQYISYSVTDKDTPSGLVTMHAVFGFAR